MINILEIPDQYFFVWDRARHEAALDGLELVSKLANEDTEEEREILKHRITPVVGFRQAEKLKEARPEEVREALQAVRERQQYLKGYLEERFETARQRAAARYPEPEVFGGQEVRRDAAFYTLARSGLMLISDALMGGSDWEQISGEISNGERLERYLPNQIIELTRDLLPRAILFNEQRDELKAVLRSYGLGDEQLRQLDRALPEAINLDLPENQREQVNTMLERCVETETDFEREFGGLAQQLQLGQQESQELKKKLKKVVKGSAFRLARGLDGLRNGMVDEGVLISSYKVRTILKWYPLGEEISRLGLKEDDRDHVHSRNSRYASLVLSSWLDAEKSMPINLINSLGIEDVSCWCTHSGSINTLDPRLDISPNTLGRYIGHFLFGKGYVGKNENLQYSPTKIRDRDWFLDLLEELGNLTSDPSTRENPLKRVHQVFGRESDTQGTVKRYSVPRRILDLTRYALECYRKDPNPTMAAVSLESWMAERLSRSYGKAIELSMKPEYETDIRRMCEQVGLNISSGLIRWNKKVVYVRNPEIVGYRPERL